MFTNSPSSLTICPLQKTTSPNWTIYSWQVFILNRMCTYVKNKLQICSVTQHQCRRRQMFGKCSQIQFSYTHFLSCYKKRLVLIEQSIHGKDSNSLSMSSHAKNKLQMCSVTQHLCRWRQICWKCSQIHQVHSLFVRYKKRLVLIEQSIHGKVIQLNRYVLLC